MLVIRNQYVNDKINSLMLSLKYFPPLTLKEIEAAANSLGIRIIRADIGDCKGLAYYEDGVDYIFINKTLPQKIILFTLAHELGHIILGHHQQRLTNVSSQSIKILEAEADLFACKLTCFKNVV